MRATYATPIQPLLALLIAVLAAGCAPKTSVSNPIYYYTLNYAAPEPRSGPQLPIVMAVERFSASPPYNSQRMIYADKGMHRNAYASHQWIAPPAELLPFLIARDLRATLAFKAVLPPDVSLGATHRLSGWVEEFLEKDEKGACRASLLLHVTLQMAQEPDPARRIVFQESYHAESPCGTQTPAALAEAMSVSMQGISQQIAAEIQAALTR